jgi:2-keto-4-pentenoate hydratase
VWLVNVEENTIEFGEVFNRDRDFVGGALELARYRIATNRFPSRAAVIADRFENEGVHRVHCLIT